MGARISVSVHLETWEGDNPSPSFEDEISGKAKRMTKSIAFEQSGNPGDILPGILAEIETFAGGKKVGN